MYFAKSKQCSMLNTVCSHISNLFEGVQKKFEYKMRLVYAHFPINVNIVNGGKTIEIRNFLGEKVVRTVHMLPGALVEKSASTKDELVISSTDIDLAGRSAALIHQRHGATSCIFMPFPSFSHMFSEVFPPFSLLCPTFSHRFRGPASRRRRTFGSSSMGFTSAPTASRRIEWRWEKVA